FRVNRFGRRPQEGAVELETVFESEPGAVEALVGVDALETYADGMVTVFIQGQVIGRRHTEIIVIENAAGGLVVHRYEANAPGIVDGQFIGEDGRVDGDGG